MTRIDDLKLRPGPSAGPIYFGGKRPLQYRHCVASGDLRAFWPQMHEQHTSEYPIAIGVMCCICVFFVCKTVTQICTYLNERARQAQKDHVGPKNAGIRSFSEFIQNCAVAIIGILCRANWSALK